MRICCIIPARGGSKGVANKNIRDIAGKPLIAWSIEEAIATKAINAGVWVTSDSDDILSVAKQYGAETIKRPAELATDTATSEAALTHALNHIQESQPIDLVVFLQCTSPIRRPDDIANAIETLVSEQADSLLSVTPLQDHFLWEQHGDEPPRSINYDFRNRKRRQDLQETYLENGSIFVFSPRILLEENNRLGGKIAMYKMDKVCSYQIDDPDDFILCEGLLKGLNL